MGTLTRVAPAHAKLEVKLAARALAGRAPTAWIRLEHPATSHEHAVLEWHEGCWRLRDLASRNGTSINDARCTTDFHELCEGDVLTFGDTGERWQLTDASSPPPAATAGDGLLRLGEADVLLLPGDDEPSLSVHREGSSWVCDDGNRSVEVRNGERLEAGNRQWELLLPTGPVATTLLRPRRSWSCADLHAAFEYSREEEFVRIVLRHDSEAETLPSRAFNYLLLVLARARAAETEAGWIGLPELASMLNTTEQKINLDVFRARRFVAGYGVTDAARIVERHAPTRGLRFGISRVSFSVLA